MYTTLSALHCRPFLIIIIIIILFLFLLKYYDMFIIIVFRLVSEFGRVCKRKFRVNVGKSKGAPGMVMGIEWM